jgi:hypothetical protein
MWLGVVIGIVLTIGGYQLRYKQRYSLIAGYDPGRTKHPQVIARVLGAIFLVWGPWAALLAILSHAFPTAAPWDTIQTMTVMCLPAAVIVGSVFIRHGIK